jgi:hypothetical protein
VKGSEIKEFPFASGREPKKGALGKKGEEKMLFFFLKAKSRIQ